MSVKSPLIHVELVPALHCLGNISLILLKSLPLNREAVNVQKEHWEQKVVKFTVITHSHTLTHCHFLYASPPSSESKKTKNKKTIQLRNVFKIT